MNLAGGRRRRRPGAEVSGDPTPSARRLRAALALSLPARLEPPWELLQLRGTGFVTGWGWPPGFTLGAGLVSARPRLGFALRFFVCLFVLGVVRVAAGADPLPPGPFGIGRVKNPSCS